LADPPGDQEYDPPPVAESVTDCPEHIVAGGEIETTGNGLMVTGSVIVEVQPPGALTVRVTLKLPGPEKNTTGLVAVEVVPLPKSHCACVKDVDVLIRVTESPIQAVAGLNDATGRGGAGLTTTVSELVQLPSETEMM
jgi:hypothetical protein